MTMNSPDVRLRPAAADDAERLYAVFGLDHVPSYLSARTRLEIEASFSDPDDE